MLLEGSGRRGWACQATNVRDASLGSIGIEASLLCC